MASFLQPYLIRITRNKLILGRDYHIMVDRFSIHVYTGAKTNGDSIPPIIRKLFNSKFDQSCLPACLVHDNLYAAQILSRKNADEIYYKLLVWNGYSPIKAKLKYIGLRLGGWVRWNTLSRANREAACKYISAVIV